MNKSQLDKTLQTVKNYVDGQRKIAIVGSDTADTAGWYKVAEQTCSGNGDTNITFAVTSTYANYYSGILELQVRSDNTSISCKVLKWLTRIGFDVNHFIVVISGMKWTLYAYQPLSQYGRIAFEILSETSISSKNQSWTLTFKDNKTRETKAPTATVKSTDGATVACANKLSTARKISLIGDVTGNATFDGSADISITATVADSSHNHGAGNITSGTLSADRLATSGVAAGSYGPSANASPAHSDTFSVPYITVDNKGRVTAASTKTITLPADNNTDTKVTNTLGTTTKFYVTGTTSSSTNTGTQTFDTGVYVSTTAGELVASKFTGALNGNANTATKLATARNINGTAFDGSGAITTANWGTARNIYIADSSATNTGSAVSVNGSGNVTLKLPATIKASITGNCSGSSGSCTGNAATATKLQNARKLGAANFDGTGNVPVTSMLGLNSTKSSGSGFKNKFTKIASINVNGAWSTCSGKLFFTSGENDVINGILNFCFRSNGDNNATSISLRWETLTNSSYADSIRAVKTSTGKYDLYYMPKGDYETLKFYAIASEIDKMTLYTNQNYVDSITAAATSTLSAVSGSTTGNAGSATKLKTARSINGTNFDGTGNITTANWGTARTITIGGKGKSVNGSANVSWTLDEIGAAPKSHTHNYAGSSSAGGVANSSYKLEVKANNTITSISNDTTSKWGEHGNSVHWYTNTGQLTDQPSSWGYLLNIGNGSEVHQIWMTQASGNMAHRGGNTSGWSGTWRTILDSVNYTSIITPASIGAATTFAATTSAAGIVQLSSSTSGTSETKAATEKAVKTAYDKANHSHNYLSTSGGTVAGDITLNVSSKDSKLIIYNNQGNKFILTTPYRSSGDVTVTLPTGSGTIAVGAFIPLSGTSTVSGSISPNLDNKYALGTSSKRWSIVYSSGGCLTSSDSKLKENIKMVPKSKEDIPYTTDVDIEESVCSEDLYNYVKNTGVYTYNLKNTERNTLGVLADEIPENIFMKIGEYSKTEEEYQNELIRKEELLKINETLDVTELEDDSMVLDTGLTYSEFKEIIENEVEEPVRLLEMTARIAMLQEVLGIALNKIEALEEKVRTLKEN